MVMTLNLLAAGSVISATLPSAAPRANAVTESTFDFWQPTGPDTLLATFSPAEAADGAFFAAHSLGTAGATLTVYYYDGTTWQAQATVTPPDDQPFLMIWPRRSALGWGFGISAPAVVGVAWIGPRLVIPGGVQPDYAPVWASRAVTKLSGVSRKGQFLGQRIERMGASLSATFMPLQTSFVETSMAAFRDWYNEGRAFVWASAPSVFTDDAAYCWAAEDAIFQPRFLTGDLMNLSLTMEAYVEP